MSIGATLYLVVGGAVFLYWAAQMFRQLFALCRRASDRSGVMFPGLGVTLRIWGEWLTSEDDRPARRRLGLTTLALFAWIGGNVMRTL